MCLFCMTVKISNYETPCSHEASDSQFNYGQIMQDTVTCATAKIISEI